MHPGHEARFSPLHVVTFSPLQSFLNTPNAPFRSSGELGKAGLLLFWGLTLVAFRLTMKVEALGYPPRDNNPINNLIYLFPPLRLRRPSASRRRPLFSVTP